MEAKLLADRLAHERTTHRRVSDELQRLTLVFAEQRRAAGASWKAVSAELGMSLQTLMYWRHGHRVPKARGKLARVEVVQDVQTTGFVLHAPGGLRIEHMTVEQLGELLKRLR
jgi:hypothetical protein